MKYKSYKMILYFLNGRWHYWKETFVPTQLFPFFITMPLVSYILNLYPNCFINPIQATFLIMYYDGNLVYLRPFLFLKNVEHHVQIDNLFSASCHKGSLYLYAGFLLHSYNKYCKIDAA